MRRLLIVLALVLAGAVTATLAYAPYLPQLVAEGVPPLTWPAPGHFATIQGAETPRDLRIVEAATSRPLPPDLAAAFSDKGGKALLVAHAGRLELERYAPGADAQTRFNSFSMAKSLVGALVYRALAEGKLTNLDQTLGEGEQGGVLGAGLGLGQLAAGGAGLGAHLQHVGRQGGGGFGLVLGFRFRHGISGGDLGRLRRGPGGRQHQC